MAEVLTKHLIIRNLQNTPNLSALEVTNCDLQFETIDISITWAKPVKGIGKY